MPPRPPRSKPYKQVRLRQLRAFCACARERSFSAAARALGLSQPVVWEQVRALERQYGTSLLTRRGHTLLLTEDGEAFLDLAARIVAGMDSLADRFAERQAGLVRHLTVTGAPSLMNEELAAVAAAFCRRRPDVRLTVLTELHEQVLDMVATGNADVGIVQLGMPAGAAPQVTGELLYERPWHLFAPAGHPLLRKRRLALADVVAHPLVLEPAGHPWRAAVDAGLREAGLADAVRVSVEINNLLGARRFVSLGMGVTIAPRPPAGIALPNVESRPLGRLFPPEQVLALWRTGATPNPAARQFCDLAREMLAARPGRQPPAATSRSGSST